MSLATDLAGTLAVCTYHRAAEALALTISNCRETTSELTELQTIELYTAIIQAFDGLSSELASHLEIDSMLRLNADEILKGLGG